jgi:hypothetical protein
MTSPPAPDATPAGREPSEARTALPTRLGLAIYGLVVALAGAAWARWIIDPPSTLGIVLFLIVAAVALANLVYVARRIRRARR